MPVVRCSWDTDTLTLSEVFNFALKIFYNLRLYFIYVEVADFAELCLSANPI